MLSDGVSDICHERRATDRTTQYIKGYVIMGSCRFRFLEPINFLLLVPILAYDQLSKGTFPFS